MSDQNNAFTVHSGLHAIAANYDVFLCDLWGVIHNGHNPYDGVLATLHRLIGMHKMVIFISNVPIPNVRARQVIAGIGVPEGAYTTLVTSADTARHALEQREDPFHAALGSRYYALGAGRHGDTLVGLKYQYERVSDIDDADWILNCGPNPYETPDDFIPLFKQALQRQLPMVGVNPDHRVMHGDKIGYCAGALCAQYGQMGGRFIEHGKPYPRIYRLVQSLQKDVPPDRMVMIGDTIHTDIAGAHGVGIAAALVTHGIHAPELNVPLGGGKMAKYDDLAALFNRHGSTPEHVLPAFIWE